MIDLGLIFELRVSSILEELKRYFQGPLFIFPGISYFEKKAAHTHAYDSGFGSYEVILARIVTSREIIWSEGHRRVLPVITRALCKTFFSFKLSATAEG